MTSGYFKGVYHVYPSSFRENYTEMEEFYFECFEDCFPLNEKEGLHNILGESDFKRLLLDFEEVANIKEIEFYFEILGKIEVRYVSFDTYYGTEHDIEFDFPEVNIRLLKESEADFFNER